MPFRLKPGRPLGREVRRVFERQLDGAIANLQAAEGPSGLDAFHEARKHVKKARAALRFVRGTLGDEFGPAKRRLGLVNRALGTVADARAVVGTLDRLQGFDDRRLPASAIAALRTWSLARAAHLGQRAEFDRVRDRTIRSLQAERRQADRWKLKARGRSAVIREIEATHRSARAVMNDLLARPTARGFHAWRRRVKTELHMLRLVAGPCGDRLADDARRLAALDGCLGELHNVCVLQDLIAAESPLSRRETADSLRALRSYRRDLRRKALTMGRIYHEQPRVLASRVRQLWGSPGAGAGPGVGTGSWPRVA